MTSLNRRRSNEAGVAGGGSFHRSTQFHEKTNRSGASHATPFNEQSSIHSCSTHNSEQSQATTATAQSRPLPDQSAFDRSVGGVGGGGLNSSFTSCPATPGRNASFCPATPIRSTPSWGMAQPASSSAKLSERSSRSSHKGPSLDISDDQIKNTSSYNSSSSSSASSSSSSTGFRCVPGRDDHGLDGNDNNNLHNIGGNTSTKSQDLNHSLWLSRQQSLTANKGTLIELSFFSSAHPPTPFNYHNPIIIRIHSQSPPLYYIE